MSTQQEVIALDIKFLNQCLSFIEQATKKAYELYKELDAKEKLEKSDWEKLNSLYQTISDEIQHYYKHYEEAQESPKDGYLNAWLYKYDNIDKLNLISWFLEETETPEAEGE